MIFYTNGKIGNSKNRVFNSNNLNNKPIDSVFSDFEIPITAVLLL